MAIDISHNYIERLKFPRYPVLHIRILFYSTICRCRKFLRKINRIRRRSGEVLVVASVTKNFEDISEFFQENRWGFIENFFPTNFYEQFKKDWPKRAYFNPPVHITKGYDVGFKWNRDQELPESIKMFPEILSLLNYFRSEVWSQRLTTFVGSNRPLKCNSFMLNRTYAGSCVIPHKDTPLEDNLKPFINLVIFIDGSFSGDSGQLLLSNDNDQVDVFFRPSTLKNSCIIYDTDADFYHGFPPVARGNFRLALTCSFCP